MAWDKKRDRQTRGNRDKRPRVVPPPKLFEGSDPGDVHHLEDPAIEREVRALVNASPIVRYTRGEVERQENAVEDLMVHGMLPHQVRRILKGDPSKGIIGQWPKITQKRVDILCDRVRERWQKERAKTRDSDREAAIRRIARFRQWASGEQNSDGTWKVKPNHAALVAYERILMDLQGTREAIKVDVDVRYTEAMLGVVARLEGDEGSKLLEEAREQERLANAARRLLPSHIIDAEVEGP